MPDKNSKLIKIGADRKSDKNPPTRVHYVTFSLGIKRWWTVGRLLGPIKKTSRIGLGFRLMIRSVLVGRLSDTRLVAWCQHWAKIALVVWGRRPGSQAAFSLAQKNNLPCIALEDGFLRSYGTGQHFPPIALIQDGEGIYYDSRSSSALETLLNSDINLLGVAGHCVDYVGGSGGLGDVRLCLDVDLDIAFDRIIREGLSKYNHAPPVDASRFGLQELTHVPEDGRAEPSPEPVRTKRILVVDQTIGDMSVVYGGASTHTFEDMLRAALKEHPDAIVFVKTHPEVTSGRKSGYLSPLLDPNARDRRYSDVPRVVPLRESIEPASLIRLVDHVYVVSSTMGFEALMHGKPVTCFGMPWYAGWGVTDDRQVCARRTRKRSVKELFAAGYAFYTTYVNPVTYARGSVHDAIDWLVRQKVMARFLHGENGLGRVFVYGFQRWKAYNLRPMLALNPKQLIFVSSVAALEKHIPVAGDTVMVWGADVPPDLAELTRPRQVVNDNARQGCLGGSADCGLQALRVLHVEDGFLRSVGLGSDMIKPQSLVFDARGLYFDARQPSDLEYLLQNTAFSEDELVRAAELKEIIVEHALTKYNLEASGGVNWKVACQRGNQYSGEFGTKRRVIFLPGQVEDDASIQYGCVDIRTNLALIKVVRSFNPDAWIVYKPHPDVVSGNRVGQVPPEDLARLVDRVETEASVIDCINACDEVHTMTSLTGFDALLRGKRVVTYGQPFYAGWGLTHDRCVGPALGRRTRRLSLDELVAGVLLKYPVYWDWNLRGYTTCEAVIERLVEQRSAMLASGQLAGLLNGSLRRLARKASVLIKAWSNRLN